MQTVFARMQSAGCWLHHAVKGFSSARGGATAIEYGLIAAGIAVAIIAAVFALGDELNAFFGGIQTQLNSKQPG